MSAGRMCEHCCEFGSVRFYKTDPAGRSGLWLCAACGAATFSRPCQRCGVWLPAGSAATLCPTCASAGEPAGRQPAEDR